MAGELRLNFDSYLDNLDTFSMIEMKNRETDQMNIKQKNAENQLAKIERLLKSPLLWKSRCETFWIMSQKNPFITVQLKFHS